MSDQYDFKVEYLKALSSSIRLKMLDLLNKGPMFIEDIKAEINLHGSVVSQHLRKLQVVGIIKSSRQGRYVKYEIRDIKVIQLLSMIPERG